MVLKSLVHNDQTEITIFNILGIIDQIVEYLMQNTLSFGTITIISKSLSILRAV